ncbi:MAG: glycosyltransferase family A protein [Planctomycetota bacterium]
MSAPTTNRPGGKPRVGVVIPVYNRRTVLLETLPFVLHQSLPPDVLAIADDGSNDGTADAAEQWLASERRPFEWHVLKLPHRTAADARASGYDALGETDYVAFLDSDDHWPADFLARGVAALEACPEAVAASADGRYTDTLGLAPELSDRSPLATDPIGWMLRYGAGIASCSLLRSAAHEVAGGWEHRGDRAEDTNLFCTMATLGPWLHLPGEPVDYYLGNAVVRGEADNLSRRDSCMSFRWARVYESIVDRIGNDDRASVRAAMARIWRNAGRELEDRGHVQAARGCYTRSLRWQRVQYNATRRLLKSYFETPAKEAA